MVVCNGWCALFRALFSWYQTETLSYICHGWFLSLTIRTTGWPLLKLLSNNLVGKSFVLFPYPLPFKNSCNLPYNGHLYDYAHYVMCTCLHTYAGLEATLRCGHWSFSFHPQNPTSEWIGGKWMWMSLNNSVYDALTVHVLCMIRWTINCYLSPSLHHVPTVGQNWHGYWLPPIQNLVTHYSVACVYVYMYRPSVVRWACRSSV